MKLIFLEGMRTMVSKNNHLLNDRQCKQQKPKFALRKLSIGVASVLLGTTFLMGEANVHADTVTDANQENEVTSKQVQNNKTSDQSVVLPNSNSTV